MRVRLTIFLLPLLLTGCGSDRASYTRDIEPVLQRNCQRCHTSHDGAVPMGGFSVDSYATLAQGSDNGPVVVGGYPDSSKLVSIMLGKMKLYKADGDHYAPMDKAQREALVEWVELGALKN